MAQTNKFDKLNNLAIPYEQFFGEMDLEDSEKEKRIELADLLDDMFFYYLAMLDEEEADFVKRLMKNQFEEIVADFYNDNIEPNDHMDIYINEVVESVVDTAMDNKSNDWYKSLDRAKYVAEGTTNGVANHYQDRQAWIDGKREKEWGTILDGKERHTHMIANKQRVPIGEPFIVGDSKLMYPGDSVTFGANLKEIINCRCSCRYY